MLLSKKEVEEIRARLANIYKSDKTRAKKNYIDDQVRFIRLVLIKAERREKNTLL